MEYVLFFGYLGIFIYFIYRFVVGFKRKETNYWLITVLAELIMMIVARVLMNYYDSLPGTGWMPGFTYLGEYVMCYGAAWVYGISLVVTSLVFLVIRKKFKRN